MSEIACKKCGCYDRATRVGKGPHAYEAYCLGCGGHVQWVSKVQVEMETLPEDVIAGLMSQNEWAAIKAARNGNVTLFWTAIKKRDQYAERL